MKPQNLESNRHFRVGLSLDRSTTSFMSDAGRWSRARKNHWKEVTMDRRRNQKEEKEEFEIIKQVTVVIITNSVALCCRKCSAKFDAPGTFSVMKPILPFFFFWRTPRIYRPDGRYLLARVVKLISDQLWLKVEVSFQNFQWTLKAN